MPYSESDLLPISALQHLLFCERQCALIHLERLWEENRWTVEGQVLHRKAHEGKPETRNGERITRSLRLRSFRLGLFGMADIVRWRPPPVSQPRGRTLRQALLAANAEELADWSVTPVEYKRGEPKKNACDRVQLCAQAMCLEEMLGIEIHEGQLYYGAKRRRTDVVLDAELREQTSDAATRLHTLLGSGITPPAMFEKKCETCSLLEVCLPEVQMMPSAKDYVSKLLTSIAQDQEPAP